MYKLSNEEKTYLRKIVINTRNNFFKKNRYVILEENIEDTDEKLLISVENIEINFEIKCDKEIKPIEIEKVFRDRDINNIVKNALTLREKLVLFLYYFENKTDLEVGKTLNIKMDAARMIRTRALKKIKDNYKKLKGENENV